MILKTTSRECIMAYQSERQPKHCMRLKVWSMPFNCIPSTWSVRDFHLVRVPQAGVRPPSHGGVGRVTAGSDSSSSWVPADWSIEAPQNNPGRHASGMIVTIIVPVQVLPTVEVTYCTSSYDEIPTVLPVPVLKDFQEFGSHPFNLFAIIQVATSSWHLNRVL